MMQLKELIGYLDGYLEILEFEDYGPQGLQVEGKKEVHKVTLSVDAALAALESAVAHGADLHLVHHGLFWGDAQRLVGALGQRVRTLIKADMNLYAVHLALDAHPTVGNNAVLAHLLDIEVTDWWAEYKGKPMGVLGDAPAGTTFEGLLARVNSTLDTTARAAPYGPAVVRRVGIVSGGAADEIGEAAALGLDTYITGESSHNHYWDPAEHRINVIYAGHYATETVGVKALGAHLSEQFGLAVEFLDFPTGL
jgi:dinuclear metal center YbgI/SA1388 family protein